MVSATGRTPTDRSGSPARRAGRRDVDLERQTCLVVVWTSMAIAGAREREKTRDAQQDARERILDSSYELFSRRGVRDVGVDELIEHAGIAKATLYRHFPSKDELVLAFLERREELWTRGLVEAGAKSRGSTPKEQLLAIFDVFDEWFRREDFEACSFINVMLEMGPDHPVGRASARHLENVRSVVRDLAADAGLRDPASFAHSLHILMKGSIVAAAEGDIDAAKRARSMARMLIEQYS